jgi:Domain of unknown function (DUF4383)
MRQNQPTRLYTAIVGVFLLLQGTSTLAFRLTPTLDAAFPQLLATTRMMPLHSGLHIVTGLLALVALSRWTPLGPRGFTLGFGLFYTGLALVGFVTQKATIFELQPFDHPFHLVVGLVGLLIVGFGSLSDLRKAPR